MKINNSSDFDLDLFFCCKYFPFMCHFASAGLQISNKNFFTNYHHDFRKKILNNNTFKFEFKLNPNLEKIIANKREIDSKFDFENYTRDFIKYAQYGLFSFDRTYLEDSKSDYFHLVAYPIINNHNYIDFILKYFNENHFPIFNHFITDFHFLTNRNFTDINDYINENFQNSIKIKL